MENPGKECLGLRLGAAFRRVDRLFGRAFRALDLPHSHGQLLLLLLREGEMRVGDLAARTGHEPSTAARLLGALSRRKLVRFRTDPADGRATLFRPAARAESLRPDLERLQSRVNDRLRSSLSAADLEACLRVLSALDRLP